MYRESYENKQWEILVSVLFFRPKSINLVGSLLTLWNPQKIHVVSSEPSQNALSLVIQNIGSPDLVFCTNVHDRQWIDEKLNFIQYL